MSERIELTDRKIEHAKAAREGRRNMLWDSLVPSLALRVTDKAHKSFVIQRRVNGRMLKLTLGEYPALGLADAREAAREKIREISRGLDPRQSMPPRITASGLRRDSFEGAVEAYIKREVPKRRPRTQDEITRPLKKLLVPKWGTLPLAEIDARMIDEVLDELVADGTPIAANRTLSVVRRFFGWCIEKHLLANNPAASLRKPSLEKSRERFLDDDELREVWLASQKLEWPFGPFFRALILTGQRRNELAGATWREVDFAKKEWTIPPCRTKNGKEHIVPLSDAMVALLAGAPMFEREEDEPQETLARPVFTTNGKTPVSGFSRAKTALDRHIMNARPAKLGSQSMRDPARMKTMPGWTLHDLRRSCATGMGRIGVQPHVIETVLNHSGGFRGGVAGVYQRHSYLEERRKALAEWADHVAGLSAPRAPSENVVRFGRAKR